LLIVCYSHTEEQQHW